MAPIVYCLVFLVTLVLDPVFAVRFRSSYYYNGYRYTRYRYTTYYYTGSTYGGRIAGIVIGCLICVGVIIAAIVTVCLLCRRRRTGGRLITPPVFSPNTTSVVPQGNSSTLWTEPPGVVYSNPPGGATYPPGSIGFQGQKSEPMPPPYDAVVGGPTGTTPFTSGTVEGISSPPDMGNAQRF